MSWNPHARALKRYLRLAAAVIAKARRIGDLCRFARRPHAAVLSLEPADPRGAPAKECGRCTRRATLSKDKDPREMTDFGIFYLRGHQVLK
jgi:hypothetical protein